MKILIDTCIWSVALRRQKSPVSPVVNELQHLIQEFRAQMIGVIRQEILSGIRFEAQFTKLKEHLRSFPDIPLITEDYEKAAEFFNLCRSKGIQGSNTDFLICAVAIRNNFLIYTTDQDFEQYAQHLPIKLHRPDVGENSEIPEETEGSEPAESSK